MAEAYNAEAILCHRLDKETSGALLIAKSAEIYREISIAFQERRIDKTYWAIADGRHYFDKYEVEVPLGQSARGKAKVDYANGKPAQTIISSLENFKHFTLLECKPITGRLHQIRIHAAIHNAPLTGDAVYGKVAPNLSKIKKNFSYSQDRNPRPLIERCALHARRLNFQHGGKVYNLEAPLPKDFDVMLNLLRKYDV